MDNNNAKKKIFLIIIVLSFFLLLLMTMLLGALSKETDNAANSVVTNEITDLTVTTEQELKTMEQVIAKYKCQYINRDGNIIYLKLSKDLYDDSGASNEQYFNAFVDDLAKFFLTSSFRLVDEEKGVNVYASYDFDLKKHIITFNNQEDFYAETDGSTYIAVQKSKIVDTSVLFTKNLFIDDLIGMDMYFTGIEKYLTERKELDSGYLYFPNEHIQVRLAPNNGVMNIVFDEDYEGEILTDVTTDTPLYKIAELHPDYTSGGLENRYLGYRNRDLYFFFYEDEISVYGYLYKRNKNFENALDEYLDTKDLDKFYRTISRKIQSYDVAEYDPESQSLYMLFPTRGIEIDIQGNDPKGITLYNSFYFTDKTKQYVKDGLISFRDQDLVQIYEKGRRSSK